MKHPSIAKRTYKTKPRGQFQFSPLDGAQFANTSAAQITTNPKEDYKNNYNTTEVTPPYTQIIREQEKPRQSQPYFPTQVKKYKYAK